MMKIASPREQKCATRTIGEAPAGRASAREHDARYRSGLSPAAVAGPPTRVSTAMIAYVAARAGARFSRTTTLIAGRRAGMSPGALRGTRLAGNLVR